MANTTNTAANNETNNTTFDIDAISKLLDEKLKNVVSKDDIASLKKEVSELEKSNSDMEKRLSSIEEWAESEDDVQELQTPAIQQTEPEEESKTKKWIKGGLIALGSVALIGGGYALTKNVILPKKGGDVDVDDTLDIEI